MNKELITKTIAMFDSPEKWNAFLELAKQKDSIKNLWLNILQEAANTKFINEERISEWEYKPIGNTDMQWFLPEFGDQSISFWMEYGTDFSLWVNSDSFDLTKIKELLKTAYYDPINYIFKNSKFHLDKGYLFKEVGNYSFGSLYDTKFESDELCWYAGNKTEEFLKQIVEKVNMFRKNEKITNLLKELNKETKF